MTNKFLYLLLAVFCLFSKLDSKSATISGYVSGSKEKQLQLFYPFNDFSTVWFLVQEKGMISLDSLNRFHIDLRIVRPSFIRLYIDYNPVDLFVDDSSELFVEIHLDSIQKGSHNNWLNIQGKYSSGNLYFNEYNFYPAAKFAGVTDFFADTENYELPYLKENINRLVRDELRGFDSLFQKKEIDSVFLKIISKTIQAFLYREVIRHPLTSLGQRSKIPLNQITHLVTWLFDKCNPYDPDLLRGVNGHLFVNYFFLVKAQQNENKRLHEPLKDSVIKMNGNSYLITNFFKHLVEIPDSKLKENLWGESLFSCMIMFKGMVTNNDFEAFKFHFPSSKWIPYLRKALGDSPRTKVDISISSEIYFIKKLGGLEALNGANCKT